MKIAGIWVNEKKPPTREVAIREALKSRDYRYKKDALKLIEKELEKSGLFSTDIEKTGQSKKKPRSSSGKSSVGKKRGDSK